MPQVIACDALAGDGNNIRDLHTDDDDEDSGRDRPELELPLDFPPESFWLSGDAELDWFDRNALFERKDSTKGSVSNSGNLNPSFDSSSQRFSRNNLKPRASIIGLPKPCFADLKHRRACKPVKSTHLFARRSGSGTEPSSPKVSCMGRVRSKRDRSRRSRNHRKQRSSAPEPERSKPAGKRKTGLFSALRAMFRVSRGKGREGEADAPPREVDAHDIRNLLLASDVDARPRKGVAGGSPPREVDAHDIRNRLPASDIDAPPRKGVAGGSPPGLGGVRRFASGRRSGSWG